MRGVVVSAQTIGLDPVQSNSENVGNIIYLHSGLVFPWLWCAHHRRLMFGMASHKADWYNQSLTGIYYQYLYLISHLIYSCFPSRVIKIVSKILCLIVKSGQYVLHHANCHCDKFSTFARLGSRQTKGSLDNLRKPLHPPPLFLCPQGGIGKLCQQCKEGLFLWTLLTDWD